MKATSKKTAYFGLEEMKKLVYNSGWGLHFASESLTAELG
jgi:hypothetical protein